MEAADGFYLEDNKDNKDVVGPFMLALRRFKKFIEMCQSGKNTMKC
jgi:hypothetical protein